jgi:hypothetical protein
MSKRISSPSSKWPGAVVLSDPMTLPQALSWERAIRAVQTHADNATLTDVNYALLPGICACVEKWELEGLDQPTPDTFPASPRNKSIELITWLTGEITRIYTGEEEKADPNE